MDFLIDIFIEYKTNKPNKINKPKSTIRATARTPKTFQNYHGINPWPKTTERI